MNVFMAIPEDLKIVFITRKKENNLIRPAALLASEVIPLVTPRGPFNIIWMPFF